METYVLIFEEISERPTHATVMALKNIVILHPEEITTSLIKMLLTITTVRASKVIRSCLL
jgi:hypothetical protein